MSIVLLECLIISQKVNGNDTHSLPENNSSIANRVTFSADIKYMAHLQRFSSAKYSSNTPVIQTT